MPGVDPTPGRNGDDEPMTSPVKVEKVTELKARIEGSQALFLADFRGLTVSDISELRRSLDASGTKLAVVKNTLMKRAVEEAGITDLEPLLEGPTAVAFVDGDPIAAAKGLVDAQRRYRTMELKGGFMDGRPLTPADAQALSTIEPLEVLLAKVAGAAKSQMARAAYAFQALQGRFLALLEAYREKVPGADEAEAAGGDAEAEPSEALEPEAADEAPGAIEAEQAEAAETAEALTAEAEEASAELRADVEDAGAAAEAEAEPAAVETSDDEVAEAAEEGKE